MILKTLPYLFHIVLAVHTAILERCFSSVFLSAAVPLAPPAASMTLADRNVLLHQFFELPPSTLRLERSQIKHLTF